MNKTFEVLTDTLSQLFLSLDPNWTWETLLPLASVHLASPLKLMCAGALSVAIIGQTNNQQMIFLR